MNRACVTWFGAAAKRVGCGGAAAARRTGWARAAALAAVLTTTVAGHAAPKPPAGAPPKPPAPAPAAGPKHSLLVTLKEGQTMRFSLAASAEISSEGGGRSQSLKYAHDLVLALTVAKAGVDGFEIDASFESVKTSVEGPFAASYDSAAANNAPSGLSDAGAAVLKKPFRILVSPEGKITSVQGTERMVEGRVAERVYGSVAGADALKQRLAEVFRPARGGPAAAAVGESWEAVEEEDAPFPGFKARATVKTTVASADGRRLTLHVRGNTELVKQPGAEMDAKVDRDDSKGTTVWDAGKGELVSHEDESSGQFTVTPPGTNGVVTKVTSRMLLRRL